MKAQERERKLEILEELSQCTKAAARKAGDGCDDSIIFDALHLLVCAIDERIEYIENWR